MKSFLLITVISLSILSLADSCIESRPDSFQAGLIPQGLTGDYLGQPLPGDSSVLFAPGIISTGMASRDIAISPDGDELYFGVTLGAYSSTIAVCKRTEGTWTGPEIASFCKDPDVLYLEPCMSMDGKRLYFLSTLADGEEETGDQDIWYVERRGDDWSDPINPGPPVNSEGAEFYPSLTLSGNMYFTRGERGSQLNRIYRSKWLEGAFQEPELLPSQVNCGTNRFNAFVSFEEDYMIIPALGMEDSYGGVDYYISFRNEDDSWSEPLNMGAVVNSEAMREWSPYVTSDGQYLFFMSNRLILPDGEWDYQKLVTMHGSPGNGNSNIYWMTTGVIDELRARAEFR